MSERKCLHCGGEAKELSLLCEECKRIFVDLETLGRRVRSLKRRLRDSRWVKAKPEIVNALIGVEDRLKWVRQLLER